MTSQPVTDQRRLQPGLVSRAIEVAGQLANDATDVISATAGRGPAPAPFDWVTDTAGTLERHTRRVLTAEFPGMSVAGGEFRGDPGTEWYWVVTPVDGLANYRSGMPWCAYSVALLDQQGPVVGVVADPYRAQIYAAARDRGARANGTAFRLVDRADVNGAVVCAEPWPDGSWPGEFTRRAARAQCGVRVLGSAALAVTEVALGHAAATVLPGCAQWEVAGAVTLAVESGAVVWELPGAAGLLIAAPGVADQVFGWWSGQR